MNECLLKSLVIVKKEIEQLKESTKPIRPENSLGRLTRMDAIGQKSINEAALRNAEIRLTKINSALKRTKAKAKADEYGLCLVCDEEIEIKRLRAIPESTTCIDCSQD